MTLRNTTPEGFRTAAYLATKARLDAARSRTGKTARQVTCTPPNVKCGGRCIPPNWDCRLKGQGPDPHLRAVKTDPLGGLANIQRGATRIAKGVAKGSFSEVEGGKRAIIRGVVKATPGDLQRKQKLQATLENRTRAIGIGLAVVTGGLGAHALLMKSNPFGYREGVGANINNAVRLGMSRILDATPVIGANRARVRRQVGAAIGAQLERQANPVSSVLTNQLARSRPTPFSGGAQASDTTGASNLVRNLKKVNDKFSGEPDAAFGTGLSNFDRWDREHQRAFFNTTKIEDNVGLPKGTKGNIFARPATDEFLVRQFNLSGPDTDTTKSIKDAIRFKLDNDKQLLLDLAQQQGFSVKNTSGGRVIDDKAKRRFIQGVVRSALPLGQGNRQVRSALTEHLEQTLDNSPRARTNALYRATYEGFNTFYNEQAKITRDVAEVSRMTKEMRKAGAEPVILDGRIARAQYLLQFQKQGAGKQIQGDAHAELVLRDYFATNVSKAPRRMYTITERLAVAAASELEGRPVSARDAFNVLEREGFTGAVPAVAARPARPARGAQAQVGDLARSLREAAQRRGETMSLEASYRAARAEIARRQRGDSTEHDLPPRVRAYLATRADFKEGGRLGKPCGASHIPKAHKCRKGAGSAPESESPKSSSRGKKLALAAGGVALAGAAALGGKAVFSNRQNIPLYKATAKHISTGIKKMSSDKVKSTINKLPEKFQGPANKLLGKAKVGLAVVAADAQGLKLTKVDSTNNFSTFKDPKTGHVMSIGAVDDTLVTFVSTPSGKAGAFDKFGIAFQTDLSFDQKKGLTKAQGLGVAKQVKTMFKAQLAEMPENAVLFNNPYKDDGLGDKRNAIYRKFGFKELAGLRGGNMWALKNEGKLTEIPDSQTEYVARLIRGDRADAAPLGKPCGASHIPKAHECRKGAGGKSSTSQSEKRPSAKRLVLAGALAGAAALAVTAPQWTPAAQRILNNAKPFDKNNPPQGAKYLTEGVSGRTWISQDDKYVIKTPKGKVNKAAFANEVNTQNALHAAGISVPKIHNVDSNKGVVMMDYLKGYDTVKSLGTEQKGKAVQSALREVEKMHRLGYSHGDLHMGNVLTKGSDVKLIDFGTAGPAAKNGLSDINNLLSAAKDSNPRLYTVMTNRKKALQTKISSGEPLTQKDLVAFHEAVRKDLRRPT